MRHVHCDGCGRKEPTDTPKADSVMKSVTLLLVSDGRSWAEGTKEKFEADLCDRCRPQLLHTFFKVPADFDVEIPKWLSEPASALGT